MDYDEATYAQVFHDTKATNNFMSFKFLDWNWHEKPPLLFWFMRGSVGLFGENEFALRLPSALFAIGSVILVYLITKEISSPIVLITLAYFWFTARQVRFDAPVTTTILFSLFAFVQGLKQPKWFLLFGLGLAVAVLFKSIIGLLVLPIILIYSFTMSEWKWIKNKWFWLGIFTFIIVATPWHVYQSLHFGEKFWEVYLGYNVFERITQNVLLGADNTPFWYHSWQLILVTQPWLLVFLGLSFFKKSKLSFFFFLTTIFLIVLFMIPTTRLLYYFVPALPFMAMFTGSMLNRLPKVVVILLIVVGATNTYLRVYTLPDRGFFLNSLSKMSRYQVAIEEKKVANLTVSKKLPLYLHRWQFVTTLIYYSNFGRNVIINRFNNFEETPRPFALVVPTQLSEKFIEIGNLLYKGEALTVIEFK